MSNKFWKQHERNISFTHKFGIGHEGFRKILEERERQYRRLRFWRTVAALAMLAIWTTLFLVLLAPFFY